MRCTSRPAGGLQRHGYCLPFRARAGKAYLGTEASPEWASGFVTCLPADEAESQTHKSSRGEKAIFQPSVKHSSNFLSPATEMLVAIKHAYDCYQRRRACRTTNKEYFLLGLSGSVWNSSFEQTWFESGRAMGKPNHGGNFDSARMYLSPGCKSPSGPRADEHRLAYQTEPRHLVPAASTFTSNEEGPGGVELAGWASRACVLPLFNGCPANHCLRRPAGQDLVIPSTALCKRNGGEKDILE